MVAFALACLNFVPLAPAQAGQLSAGAPKVAVVNLAAVFERYVMTQDLEQLFAQRRQDVKTAAENKQDNLSVMKNALEQFKPGTSDYQSREEELVRAEINFQVWVEVQERRLKAEHKSWLERIYHDTQETVAKIASDRGIDLVLTYSDLDSGAPDSVAFKQQILLRTVIYANKRVDLTEETIQLLDADYRHKGGPAILQMRRSGNGNGDNSSPK